MPENTWELRDSLIADLRHLEAKSEKIYLALAEDCPRLLDETRDNTANAQSVVNQVRGGGDGAAVTGILDAVRGHLAEAGDQFSKIQGRDRELLERLRTGIDALAGLEDLIGRIREDSIEMELISINAMTVALKAGGAGKAFSYITEELQRLSTKTIALTDDITKRGAGLLDRFRSFQGQVADLSSHQDDLFGGFRDNLFARFDSFSTGVERTTSLLATMSDEAGKVVKPLFKIVEEIQLQDIIRQSLDHVIISLEEIHDSDKELSDTELLDDLAFFSSLPPLCRTLLDDIAGKIRHSLDLFQDQSQKAQGLLAEVERLRRDFVATLADSDRSIDAMFNATAEGLESLTNRLSQSIQMKTQISTGSLQLTRDLHDLSRGFEAFSTLITRFHSIDIASRIEVAKTKVLQQMAGTVEEMTSLTRQIENDVESSLAATKNLIGSIGKAVGEIESYQETEREFFDEFEHRIRSEHNSLAAAKERLMTGVREFSVFSRDFFSLFAKANKQLSELSGLLPAIEAAQERLDDLAAVARDRMRPVMERVGVDDWDIENNRLQEIIKRFTIFTHKQKAGELAGFLVEEGQESGEVTLF